MNIYYFIITFIEDLRDYFRSFRSFRKEMDNIYVHFSRVFVEFVVLLTKI